MRSLVVAVLLLSSAPCLAAHPAKGDDSAQVAVRLAKLTLSEAQWKRMQDATEQSIAAQGGQLDEKEAATLEAELSKALPYQEMCDFLAGILVKYYSVDEMRQLETFYRSPLGQKALRIQPDVMRDSMGFVQSKLMTSMPAILRKVKAAHDASEK